ncbi:MAG: hypothetical protein ACRDOB_27010 [Streptosporangiaceae bacterium]
MTLGADPRVVSAWSAAQRLIEENRPCHLVWDPLTGDIAQLLPIVRAGLALGTPEDLEYAPDLLPHQQAGVNREGRLCVQIGVLGTAREPFTNYQMIGLGEILGWLDSWQVPQRWPAGAPAPYRQAARARSRARWAMGGHFGASQVPDCQSIGPGGIDIDQVARTDIIGRPLPQPALSGPSLAAPSLAAPSLAEPPLAEPPPIRLGPLTGHDTTSAASLSAAGL